MTCIQNLLLMIFQREDDDQDDCHHDGHEDCPHHGHEDCHHDGHDDNDETWQV